MKTITAILTLAIKYRPLLPAIVAMARAVMTAIRILNEEGRDNMSPAEKRAITRRFWATFDKAMKKW